MSWSDSNRLARLPADWKQIRERIGRRDNWRCQWRIPSNGKCLAPANQIDHIRAGDDHSDGNLQCLCEEHHTFKSSREGGAASHAALKALKERTARRVESNPQPKPDAPPARRGF